MTKRWIIAAGLTLFVPAVSQAANPRDPDPGDSLVGLARPEDFPADAMRLNQHGTVTTSLLVGTDGRVKQCDVIESSKSPPLDKRTCEIFIERARFSPATDNHGKPTEGRYEQKVTWRFQTGNSNIQSRAVTAKALIWEGCTSYALAKRVNDSTPVEQVIRDAFSDCAADEQAVKAQMTAEGYIEGGEPVLEAMRRLLSGEMSKLITLSRETLNSIPSEKK